MLECSATMPRKIVGRLATQIRVLATLCLVIAATSPMRGAESCVSVHGRAEFYGGDAQLRIWQIGTHHEFEPDDSSWDRVLGWLAAGVKIPDKSSAVSPASTVYLYGDFLVCPTEPLKKGSVQQAKVKSVSRRHYVPVGRASH